MVKRIAQIAGVTLLLGGVFVPTAHADTHFSLQIGAPVPLAPVAVARRGYVWQPGYRVWTGFGDRRGSWDRDRRERDRDERDWRR